MELITAKVNGWSVLSNGSPLTSRYNPIEEGRRLWSTWRRSLKPNLVVVGAAPFYPIVFALQEGAKVFLLEEQHLEEVRRLGVFNKLMQACGVKNQGNLLANLFCFADLNELAAHLQAKGLVSASALSIQISPYGDGAYLNSVRERLLSFLGAHLKHQTTEVAFGWTWHINALRQLLRRGELFFTTSLCFEGMDSEALLVGSGPSTEEHLNTLRYWSKRAVVFAAPGVARLLEQRSIRVDFLVSGDGGYNNHFHFARLPQGKEPPLIAPLSIYEGITRHRTSVFHYVDLEEHKDCLQRVLPKENIHYMPMAGTSMNSFVPLLKAMGFRSIRRFGLDFAITPFQLHSTSNTMEELFFQTCTRLEPTETLLGRTSSLVKTGKGRYTDEKLRLYKQGYEAMVARHAVHVVGPAQSKQDAEQGRGKLFSPEDLAAVVGSASPTKIPSSACKRAWKRLLVNRGFCAEPNQREATLRRRVERLLGLHR